ncbi:MAG: peptidylprolyl isomerase [Algicola sp.]|nr:peptidylprolyl isomerase [Algicola sp.]
MVLMVTATLVGCGQSADKVATVGDKIISKSEFSAFLAYKRVDENNQALVSAQLDSYLDREALAMAIEQANVLSPQKVAVELNEFKKEMLISRYFETFVKTQVTDSAIRNYYTSHASNYESKKVNVAHILIRTHANIDETERNAKYTRAHEVYSKLKAGADFKQLVSDYSEDTISAKKAGVIGWLTQGAIDPVFSDKVFNSLKKGEVSEPFQTSFGFHIVKLLEGPVVVKKPLEKVMGDIRHQLRKEAKAAELKRLVSAITIKKVDL